MDLPIIWIERIPLFRLYFSHLITKQGTKIKDICYRLGAFVLFAPPVIWFTTDMQIGHLEDISNARFFLLLQCTMKFFVFFPKYINC